LSKPKFTSNATKTLKIKKNLTITIKPYSNYFGIKENTKWRFVDINALS